MNENKHNKLFLLDAMALIFRGHFAFIRNPRVTSKGLNTSAVFGFTNSLLEILEKENPDYIGIVFDTEAPTFRDEMYEEYKANREEPPEDINIAIPIVKKMANAWNIPVLEKDGYEADDIIGTLAKQAAKEGFKVYMMTPDKDFSQLVDDEKIILYKPSHRSKPSEIWDEERVKQEFGVERIDQVVDIQGLTGDSVDNIPGVDGIGPKTAQKLIEQFDSVENLVKNTDQLKGKQKERIENQGDQAVLSKKLATIYTEAPVEFEPAKLKRDEPDEKALRQLFEELEFKSITKRVFGEEGASGAGVQGDLFDQEKTPQQKESQYHTLETVDHDYQLIRTEEALQSLVDELKQTQAFALDTETTSLNPHTAGIVGVSISKSAHKAYYVPLNDSNEADQLLNILSPVLQDTGITKVGQNIKYDLIVLWKHGINLQGPFFDTMIAHYLLEPELRHNLDYLSEVYLKYDPVSIESLIGKKGKKQGNMSQLAPEKIKDYACEDADLTWQLYQIFEPELRKHDYTKLYNEIEGPLIKTLASMEFEGVNIDVDQLNEYSKTLEKELQSLEKEIHKMAGEEFNINSPKQLGVILFEKLNLDSNVRKTRKSKQYSTSEDVLEGLASEHAIVQKVLDYRSVQKLKSTYIDALPQLINKNTGRIHTSFQQAVAATGRLSSTNPNLQNIPIRTEKGRQIRKAFIPRDTGYSLLSADYSQIELRVVAAISKDESMLEAFRSGLDIHASTAAKINKVPLEEVTSEMRRQAKTVNFGIVYGISAFGLSQRMEISRKEASAIIESYFEEFPKVKEYMNNQIDFARRHGYVETLLGRRRKLWDINSSNSTQRGFAERNAINSPIQGTAADMIKLAMVNIHEAMKKAGLKSKMTLQVHDELIFDAFDEEIEHLRPLVVEKMENALELDVPIEVDTGVGQNWLEAH